MVSVSLETEHMLDQLDLHLAPSSDSTVLHRGQQLSSEQHLQLQCASSDNSRNMIINFIMEGKQMTKCGGLMTYIL